MIRGAAPIAPPPPTNDGFHSSEMSYLLSSDSGGRVSNPTEQDLEESHRGADGKASSSRTPESNCTLTSAKECAPQKLTDSVRMSERRSVSHNLRWQIHRDGADSMRTALVTTCFLGDNQGDYRGESSLMRIAKMRNFMSYYTPRVPEDWDLIALDNASPQKLVDNLRLEQHPNWSFRCFKEHLGRSATIENDMPYLWRAVYYLETLLREYDKIVFMDNDFYVISKRMWERIDNHAAGWLTFMYPDGTPETGCHVLTDGGLVYSDYIAQMTWQQRNGRRMESDLPCMMDRTMVGDRFGEKPKRYRPLTNDDLDYWAEAQVDDFAVIWGT